MHAYFIALTPDDIFVQVLGIMVDTEHPLYCSFVGGFLGKLAME